MHLSIGGELNTRAHTHNRTYTQRHGWCACPPVFYTLYSKHEAWLSNTLLPHVKIAFMNLFVQGFKAKKMMSVDREKASLRTSQNAHSKWPSDDI